MKRKLLLSLVVLLVCVVGFGVPASAFSRNFNVTLPAYQGQRDLIQSYKDNGNDWAYVRLDSLGGDYHTIRAKVQTKEIVWYDCSSTVTCYENGSLNFIGLSFDMHAQAPIRIKGWHATSLPTTVVATGWADIQ